MQSISEPPETGVRFLHIGKACFIPFSEKTGAFPVGPQAVFEAAPEIHLAALETMRSCQIDIL